MSITSANVSKYRVFIALTVTSIFWANTAIALQTNKNLLLSDGEDDSPQIILVDGDSKQLVLQKLDSGAATLLNEEGSICFLSDNDTDDTICFITNNNQPAIMWSGIDTLEPGIQISNQGKLQYRNAAGTWIDFDTLGSKVITGTNIEDGTIKGVDIGTKSITGAHLQPALGQDGQVLSLAEGQLAWINSGTADIAADAITTAQLADDTIVNADINASAAIAGTKIAPDFGAQLVTTTGNMSLSLIHI